MKMELIAALLHSPRILFLDEPTIGLDAVAQHQMRAFLREVNRDQGTTILLTSHYMEDIVSLCVADAGEHVGDGILHGHVISPTSSL
jgi:ABC-2 type transport system ATP-binding protein